jgi:hypothetical protein
LKSCCKLEQMLTRWVLVVLHHYILQQQKSI